MTLDEFLYCLESSEFIIFSESGDFIAYGSTFDSDYVHDSNINPNLRILKFEPIAPTILKIVIEKR